MEKLFEFDVIMAGIGETAEDAWENCLEGFIQDPGPCPSFRFVEYIEDENSFWEYKRELIEALVKENLEGK